MRKQQHRRPKERATQPTPKGKQSGTRSTKRSPEKGDNAEFRDDRGGASDNDVSWYAANEYLLRDAAAIPFSYPAGSQTVFPTATDVTSAGVYTIADEKFQPESVASIVIAPAIGDSQDALSPVNIAARNIFGFIRANQTVNAAYNQVSVMMYIIAMTSAFSFYSFCARIYGLIRTYAQRNRSIPQGLFRAMQLDYADFEANIAQFRYWMNTLAERIGALCVPASLSYTMRQMWLYQNVFMDGPTDKAQLYIYVPFGFYRYNATGHGTGTAVSPCLDLISLFKTWNPTTRTLSGTLLKVSDIMRIGNSLITPLFQNNAINTISGDILKSYGPEHLWKLLPIHEDYEVTPILNSEVLDQIHNAFTPYCGPTLGTQSTDSSGMVWCKDVIFEEIDTTNAVSYLKANYRIRDEAMPTNVTKQMWMTGSTGMLVDFDRQDVTPADVMVGTRLATLPTQFFASATAANGPKTESLLCGSEILMALSTLRYTGGETWALTPVQTIIGSYDGAASIRPFYKHPIIYKHDTSRLIITSDIENWTWIAPDVLKRLHETALLSQFHVPLMGRLIK